MSKKMSVLCGPVVVNEGGRVRWKWRVEMHVPGADTYEAEFGKKREAYAQLHKTTLDGIKDGFEVYARAVDQTGGGAEATYASDGTMKDHRMIPAEEGYLGPRCFELPITPAQRTARRRKLREIPAEHKAPKKERKPRQKKEQQAEAAPKRQRRQRPAAEPEAPKRRGGRKKTEETQQEATPKRERKPSGGKRQGRKPAEAAPPPAPEPAAPRRGRQKKEQAVKPPEPKPTPAPRPSRPKPESRQRPPRQERPAAPPPAAPAEDPLAVLRAIAQAQQSAIDKALEG